MCVYITTYTPVLLRVHNCGVKTSYQLKSLQEHSQNIAVNEINLCLYCSLGQKQRSFTCTKLREYCGFNRVDMKSNGLS